MKTTINEIDGKLVATFEGELDTAAAIEVEKEMNRLEWTPHLARHSQESQVARPHSHPQGP